MVVCNFYIEGRCRYGDKCWNEHPRGAGGGGRGGGGGGGGGGGRYQNRGGSVNRVWVNPVQRSGGNVVHPSSFSHDGGSDWSRNSSGSGRDYRSSNFSFSTQNRFSSLGTSHSDYGARGGGGGGGGGGDEIDKQIETIQKDMEAWQNSGQWLLSCYAAVKASITGFVELSPEELRMEYYTSRATGNLQSYMTSVQQLFGQWRSRVEELRSMNSNTRATLVAELNNPQTQRPSSGGFFGSSASASLSTGFGSSDSTGFGLAASSGFGSAAQPSGFGSAAQPSGFGSAAQPTGFGSAAQPSGFPVRGFGSSSQSSAAGFSFKSSPPASVSSAPQFGSAAPTTSSFTSPTPASGPASATSASGFTFGVGATSGLSGVGAGGTSSSSTGCGGFGSAAGASGFGGDGKSGGENVFTPQSELTPDELREFSAKRFTLGQIPLRPPPAELLTI